MLDLSGCVTGGAFHPTAEGRSIIANETPTIAGVLNPLTSPIPRHLPLSVGDQAILPFKYNG